MRVVVCVWQRCASRMLCYPARFRVLCQTRVRGLVLSRGMCGSVARGTVHRMSLARSCAVAPQAGEAVDCVRV